MAESFLREFFEPSSLAVIGASANAAKIGYEILRNILLAGYKGKVFPVNPTTPEILGLKTYSSVEEIPATIELAIIVVPASIVLDVFEGCSRKKVKAALIISGGFREIGECGEVREKKLIEMAKRSRIRIIGPNCQGINNPHTGFTATFAGFARRPGPIAIVSQSGTIGAAIQCWADKEGIGISKCVNLGNKVDVNEIDLLRYLKNDEDTKVIALYVEGISDGRAFMDAALEVGRSKPIVLLKGGRTDSGFKAMSSHTGSLAGRSEIFDAALKQSGIIKATTLEELYDFAKVFSFLSPPKGSGVLIIESTGGAGILASDACDKLGLKLPEPDEGALNRLHKELPEICTFSNPFDLSTEGLNPERYRFIIKENMHNKEIHSFLTIFGDPIQGVAEVVKRTSMETDKPIVPVYIGGGEVEEYERVKMQSMGIPVFPSPERGVAALNALVRYSEFLRLRRQKQPTFSHKFG